MRTRVYLGILILLAFVALLSLPAHAQFTTITMTNVENGDGLPLALGTTCWTGTNNAGTPIAYRAGTSGQTVTTPVCRDIINGAVQTTYKSNTIGTLKVADTTLTTPANVCFKVTVLDSSTGKVVLGSYAGAKSGYDCVQPSGSTWSFDTYTPAGTPNVVQVAGPTGPQGPAGLTFNAGDNIAFTGTDKFTGPFHVSNFRGEWSAFLTPGWTDVCDATVKTAAAMVAAGVSGGGIDAATGFAGVQPCANGLDGWPGTPGSNAVGAFNVRMAGNADWQTGVRFHVPTQTTFGCGMTHGSFLSSTNYTGCWVSPASTFSDTVIAELGRDVASGGVPEQGARFRGVGVSGAKPSGTVVSGSTCVLNNEAQENSGWDDLRINGCDIPIDIETAGSQGGPINAGPYRSTHINLDGVTDIATNGTCFKIGTTSTGVSQVGEFDNLWCSCVNTTGACSYMGWIDGHTVRFKGALKLEQGQNGIKFGSAHNTQDVKIDMLETVSNASHTQGNALEFTGTNRDVDAHVIVNGTTYTTNIVADSSTNGKTITVASQGNTPNDSSLWYHRSPWDTVQTDAKGIPSQLFSLTDLTLSASTALNVTSHCVNLSAGATADITFTLPATISTLNGCEYHIINSQGNTATPSMVTISRNSNLINGQGKDLCLTYRQWAHIYANSGLTVYRAEVSDPPSGIFPVPFSTTPTLAPFEHAQSITLTGNAAPTWPSTCDGFWSEVTVLENFTGSFTWTWPANVSGGMAINTAANKRNVQRFRYNATTAKWEAANAGSSF
jgi:hypothetical protein